MIALECIVIQQKYVYPIVLTDVKLVRAVVQIVKCGADG
jgi:hypothetical protein